MYFIFKNK